MTDKKQDEETKQESPPVAEPKNTDHMIPKTRLDEEIQKRKDAETKVQALETATQKAEEERLKKEKNFEELYEKATTELATMKPKAEQVEQAERTLQDVLSAQLNQVPEDRRSLISDDLTTKQKLDFIATNRTLLIKPAAEDIGAGNRGGSENTVTLTQEQKQFAKKLHVSEDDYKKQISEV